MKEIVVQDSEAGQRIDNYLLKKLKGIPKPHLYKLLRKGSIRVNKGRKKPDYRVAAGDVVRVPEQAGRTPQQPKPDRKLIGALSRKILFDDECLTVLDKPSGLAVHAGSGLRYGVIDILKARDGPDVALQLAHRLDRETSGCLVLAKNRAALLDVQAQFKQRRVRKQYLALVQGRWRQGRHRSTVRLSKQQRGGERRMVAGEEGKLAVSDFRPVTVYSEATLLEVTIETGRMHQIRSQLAHLGHPVAGDRKYGGRDFNMKMKALGLRRLFLHAHRVRLRHPVSRVMLDLRCSLPEELNRILERLENRD